MHYRTKIVATLLEKYTWFLLGATAIGLTVTPGENFEKNDPAIYYYIIIRSPSQNSASFMCHAYGAVG